jgi:hypothetical protein
MVLAAVVVVTPLLVHQWMAFGAPWRTGYGLCGESTGFGWEWFQANWWLMLGRLNTSGLAFVFPIGLVGLAYVVTHDRRRAVFLGLWIVPTVLLYTAYYWAPQGDNAHYVRFFSSVFPPLIVCALIVLCEALPSRRGWSVALGILVAIVATFNFREALVVLGRQAEALTSVVHCWSVVRAKVPNGAVLIAGGPTLNHLEYVGNYEMYASETFHQGTIREKLQLLGDNKPHPFQRRKARELAEQVGKLSDAQLALLQRSILASNLAAGRFVATVGSAKEIRITRNRLGNAFAYAPMVEWESINYTKDNERRVETWMLYRLLPRQ